MRRLITICSSICLLGVLLTGSAAGQDNWRLPDLEPITANNFSQIVKLANLGEGPTGKPLWTPDTQTTVAVTSAASWIYPLIMPGPSSLAGDIDTTGLLDPTGRILLVRDLRGKVMLWDIQSHTPVQTLPASFDDLIDGYFGYLSLSAGGELLIEIDNVYGKPRSVRIWETATLIRLAQFDQGTSSDADPIFSPAGDLIAAVSDENVINLWQTHTRQEIAQVSHPAPIHQLNFSADGRWLAASGGNIITVWDVHTLREVLRTDGELSALSPDGRWLATNRLPGPEETPNHAVTLWDLSSQRGRVIGQGTGALVFSLDSTVLVYEERTAEYGVANLHVFDLTAGRESTVIPASATVPLNYSGWTYPPQFYAEGLLFRRAGDLYRWNPQTGVETLLIPQVNETKVSSDGHYIVEFQVVPFNYIEKTLRVWDIRGDSATELFNTTFPGTDLWESVAISPDSQTVATGGNADNVREWNITSRGMTYRENNPPNEQGEHSVLDLAYSPDGRILAGCVDSHFSSGHAFLLDTETQEQIATIAAHSDKAISVAFHPTEAMIALGMEDGAIRLWNIPNLIQLAETDHESADRVLSGHSDMVLALAFSPDGRRLASASADHTVRLWDMETDETIHIFKGHTYQVWAVAFAPDGLSLASGGDDATVRLWDLSTFTGMILSPTPLPDYPSSILDLVFAPDGSVLAGSLYGGGVMVWDVNRRSPPVYLETESGGPAWHLAFSPQGTLLVSAAGSVVSVWGVPTEAE